MKIKSVAVVLSLIGILSFGCIEKIDRSNTNVADTSNAIKTYEMTIYYLVLLRRGPNWTDEKTPELEKLQNDHLAHINRLADSGDLILSGPFLEQSGDSALAGMFIFKVETKKAAQELTESDPAVKSGRLVYELYPWFGPSTLTY